MGLSLNRKYLMSVEVFSGNGTTKDTSGLKIRV